MRIWWFRLFKDDIVQQQLQIPTWLSQPFLFQNVAGSYLGLKQISMFDYYYDRLYNFSVGVITWLLDPRFKMFCL
jgi:hypothetical protein